MGVDIYLTHDDYTVMQNIHGDNMKGYIRCPYFRDDGRHEWLCDLFPPIFWNGRDGLTDEEDDAYEGEPLKFDSPEWVERIKTMAGRFDPDEDWLQKWKADVMEFFRWGRSLNEDGIFTRVYISW